MADQYKTRNTKRRLLLDWHFDNDWSERDNRLNAVSTDSKNKFGNFLFQIVGYSFATSYGFNMICSLLKSDGIISVKSLCKGEVLGIN